MDNPTDYLKKYMKKHHPKLEMSLVYSQSRDKAVYGWGHTKLRSGFWDFRMMIPRSAPENGRPLCNVVKYNMEIVWQFEEDSQQYQGLWRKERVHLYEKDVDGQAYFFLVNVLEGTPDFIHRVFRPNGDELSLEVEVLLKEELRKWGMEVTLSPEEKLTWDRLMNPKTKAKSRAG